MQRREPDSQFEIDVAEFIRGLGYFVEYQIAESGFLIDLGVKQKEDDLRYLCGIECDGPWHDGWRALQNDVQRQEILENNRWHIHRIPEGEWRHNSLQTREKLRDYLQRRKTEAARQGILLP